MRDSILVKSLPSQEGTTFCFLETLLERHSAMSQSQSNWSLQAYIQRNSERFILECNTLMVGGTNL